MKTTLKRIILVGGLLGAGSLLAYGPGFGGPGWFGHHGPMYGGYGGHMMGAGYGPMAFLDGDIDARLEKIKNALGITPEQEAAWNGFADTLKSHTATARATHQAMWSQRGGVSAQAHYQLHQNMWQQRQAVHEAAARLMDTLDENQRLKAGNLIGYGFQHPL
jgi:hypothetical protein